MTVAAISGHRPEKIPDINAVVDELKRAYHELGVTHVIQGMAAGSVGVCCMGVPDSLYLCQALGWTHAPRAG